MSAVRSRSLEQPMFKLVQPVDCAGGDLHHIGGEAEERANGEEKSEGGGVGRGVSELPTTVWWAGVARVGRSTAGPHRPIAVKPLRGCFASLRPFRVTALGRRGFWRPGCFADETGRRAGFVSKTSWVAGTHRWALS